jgi:aminoglycoside phosphotransferase (APT) family kinase protein
VPHRDVPSLIHSDPHASLNELGALITVARLTPVSTPIGTVPAPVDDAVSPLAISTAFPSLLPNPRSIVVRMFTGGQSNPTYHLQCTTSSEQFVLRKKPTGSLMQGAHDVMRECKIFKALHAWGVPVPQVVFQSDDSTVFGTPYFLMKFVDGAVYRDFGLPSLSPLQRRIVYTRAVASLSHLHSTLIEDAGLSWMSKTQNYFSRTLHTWTKQCENASSSIGLNLVHNFHISHQVHQQQRCVRLS